MKLFDYTCSLFLIAITLSVSAQPTSNPPIINGDTSTIQYVENDGLVRIDQSIFITADGTTLREAAVSITNGYNLNQDTIVFNGTTQLSLVWNDATGTLSISGNRSIAIYLELLQGLSYQNTSENPSTEIREITITVSDNKNISDPFIKSINISRVNDPPHLYETDENVVADTVIVNTAEDADLSFCPNVFDFEGDAYFLTVGSLQENSGTLGLDQSGACINYTPIKDYYGMDHFVLTVCDQNDSSLCKSTHIELQVNSVNDPPTISAISDTITFIENTNGVPIDDDMLISDDGDTLTRGTVSITQSYNELEDSLVITGSTTLSVSWNDILGILEVSGSGTLEEYTTLFRQVNYLNTSDIPSTEIREVTFQFYDGMDTSSSFRKNVQIIPVNDAPYFYANDPLNPSDTLKFITQEDVPLEFCINVFDLEGDSIMFSYNDLVNASGMIDDTATPFCVLYTQSANYHGTDYLNAQVCDQLDTLLCSSVIIEITTNSVNDSPSLISSNVPIYFEENTDRQTISEDVLVTDDNGIISEAWVRITGNYNSSQDTLILNSDSALNASWNEVTGTLNIIGDTIPDAYSNLLRQVSFLNSSEDPNPESRIVSIWVSDGGLLSDTLTFEINIIPINDSPFFSGEVLGQKTDTLFFNAVEDEMKQMCPVVFDHENDDYILEFQGLNFNSGVLSLNETKDCINYVPFENKNGYDNFIATVCDSMDSLLCDEVVISLNVTPVNDTPQIINEVENDTLRLGTDINRSIEVCLEVLDVDLDSVWIDQINSDFLLGNVDSLESLCFTYSPLVDSIGTEILQVIVCDNGIPQACDTIVLEIRFPFENSPPQFQFNNQVITDTTYGILVQDILIQQIDLFDRERDDLILDTAYLVSGTGHLEAIVSDKLEFTFIPDSTDGSTQTSLVFVVCDDRNPSLCTTLNVDVNINYPPVILDNDSTVVSELYFPVLQNTSLDSCLVLFDQNQQRILVDSIIGSSMGTLSASVDNQNTRLCLSYSTPTDSTGIETFNILLCDNGDPIGCNQLSLVFEVFATNHPPKLTGIDTITHTYEATMNENDSLSICFPVQDIDGDSLTLSQVNNLSGPGEINAVLDSSNLCISYKPPTNEFGIYEGYINICDNNQFRLCTELFIRIDVQPINFAPIAVSDEFVISTSASITLDLLANDNDPENEGLLLDTNFELQSTLGLASFKSNSEISYDPDPDEYKGDDIFNYRLCDLGVPQKCVESVIKITFNLPIPTLKIYDAFSPNGDGINDTWFIDGIREFPKSEVIIRDQWNNIVYRKKGYDNKDIVWEGKSSVDGSNLREGTYYYIIELGEGSKPLTGFIVLKR